ncbi:C39 family peptidase [Corynebacterium antarcticum]|uniref:C39 family peptidase n=1 Tax=Corynebacterium antarcticum TaxID=2800405 RepID=UPI0020064032|nr:C39 family peptidase [Corynebacterium antarcticum]MCK7661960.1 C39 family peptidase [Corynebacterium antarcticum]
MGGSLSLSRYEQLAGPFTEAMTAAGCTTQRRAAMWCAQIGHESAGLQYFRERWPSNYEDRRDLGNTVPGDGKRFIGRGPIQLTGRGNYRAFGEWCHRRGFVPDPATFTEHPAWVEEPRWGFLAAAWYWTAARPQLNTLADQADLKAATRAINGGLNGYDDRAARYQRCLQIPGLAGGGETMEKVLSYPRDHVKQDTGYYCGPASAQTVILAATGRLIPERELAQKLETTTAGTADIRNIEPVLDEYTGVDYQKVYIPGSLATEQQIDELWTHLTASIDAGYGIVANIVAPTGYYPEGVYGSRSPSYSGGWVYHYIALMGYRDGDKGRAAWVADSGFEPYGYWCSVRQLAHLIANKGYSYAAVPQTQEEEIMHPDVLNARLDRLELQLRLILDQLVGPERDEHGNPLFSGWASTDGKTVTDLVGAIDDKVDGLAAALKRKEISR